VGKTNYFKLSLFLLLLCNFIFNQALAAQKDKKAASGNSTQPAYSYQKYQDKIVSMELEYKSLKKAYEELNQKYNELKYQNGQLSWKIKELGQWNRQLHKGYGPGIWLISDSENPEFKYKSQSDKVEEIIKDLNVVFRGKKYPQVIFKKMDNNTAVLSLDKPGSLTKKMGATGTAYYLKEILYTVTSAKEVDCIYLDIPGGDSTQVKKTCR